MNTSYRHRMSIMHRIRKHSKHLRLSFGSGTKLLFTFLSLRFFDMRSERHNSFNKRAAHFVDPNWSRLGETKNRLPSSRIESQLFRSEFKSQLTVFFKFQKPQRFRAWRHSRPRFFFFLSGVFIVTSLIVTSIPHAREHLHSVCAPNWPMH